MVIEATQRVFRDPADVVQGLPSSMMRKGWGGVVISALALSGCGIFFDDDGGSGGDVPPGSDDPYPPPSTDPDPATQEQPFEGECVPQAWIDEARESASWGANANFELEGSQVQVDGTGHVAIASVIAPLTVMASAGAVIVLPDATIEGGEHGTVVIAGPDFAANAGTLTPESTDPLVLSDTAAVVVPLPATDDGARPDLGVDASAEDVAALAAAVPLEIGVDALAVSSYDRAYVVTETGTVPLSGAFVVTAPRVFWPAGSTVYADAIEATFDGEVFVGLTPSSGEFSVRGEPTAALPMAIMGRDAHLVVGPTYVATLDPMPVRQALDSYGALVDSEMQLRRCMPDTLVMSPGETRIVELSVREHSGRTDAAFSDFVVIDESGTEWTSRIELDPTMPDVLTVAAETHQGAAWGQGLIDFVEAWVEVSSAIGRGVVCVFTLGFICPDDGSSSSEPTPLAPYPAWAEPSSIYSFEVELTAPSSTGTYAIAFEATGQNYAASVPVTVIVE